MATSASGQRAIDQIADAVEPRPIDPSRSSAKPPPRNSAAMTTSSNTTIISVMPRSVSLRPTKPRSSSTP